MKNYLRCQFHQHFTGLNRKQKVHVNKNLLFIRRTSLFSATISVLHWLLRTLIFTQFKFEEKKTCSIFYSIDPVSGKFLKCTTIICQLSTQQQQHYQQQPEGKKPCPPTAVWSMPTIQTGCTERTEQKDCLEYQFCK